MTFPYRIIKIFDSGNIIDEITIKQEGIKVITANFRLTFLSNINQYLKETVSLTVNAIKSALNSMMNENEYYTETSYDSWGRHIYHETFLQNKKKNP